MSLELNESVNVQADEAGEVRHLEHLQEPFLLTGLMAFAAPTPQALAAHYLHDPEVKRVYGLQDAMLANLSGADVGLTAGAGAMAAAGSQLRLADERSLMGLTTVSYGQSYDGIPVWEAGISISMLPEPLRVSSSQSSVHHDVVIANRDSLQENSYGPAEIKPGTLKKLLGIAGAKAPAITSTRALIYRYHAGERLHPETGAHEDALQAALPSLPLPPVPASLAEGAHYMVTEVLFTFAVPGWGNLNWRAFIDMNSGAVLYLRPFVACASGMIYPFDPITRTGNRALVPAAGEPALNPLRISDTLDGLNPPVPAGQALTGVFARLTDTAAPAAAPPQEGAPFVFNYTVADRRFSAVNAYHHVDWLFRLMQGMGFNVPAYFDGTTFPVPVDHAGFGDAVNARAPGNATGTGSGGFEFGKTAAAAGAPGIAADLRVVLHEFGHALLWDGVHSPNFGFAHSCGDSLAAILADPDSQLRNVGAPQPDRFATFPWLHPQPAA